MSDVKYVIISPARNEEQYLRRTIESVVAQTIQPAQWIIIDDGSSDGTGRVAEEASKRFDWITVLRRPDRGVRRAGSGVMEAFYEGFKLLKTERWDYLVKLDADVTFERDYFAKCFARFTAEPRLGVGGGLICNLVNGALRPESEVDPRFHVRGATKIYRYECWKEIGGLVPATGWDTIDELKANMLGWTSRSFEEIPIIHHRPAGAAYGKWPNWLKNGHANYVSGYHPLFMFVKCLRRFFQRPYGVAAVGLWTGFCLGYVKRAWRVEDREFIRYFRDQQMRRLLGRPNLWSVK